MLISTVIRFSCQAFLQLFPVDVLEKRRYVVSALESVIGHEGVLENIHHQDGFAAGKMANFMLVNPLVEKVSCHVVLVQYYPTNAPHGSRGPEILFPVLVAAEGLSHLLCQSAG